MYRTLMAASIVAGSVVAASMASPAQAVSLAKLPVAPQAGVELVRGPRGPGGGGPHFHGPRGGGGPHFHGPRGPGGHFHGPRFQGPRFSGPRFYGPAFRGGYWPYYGYGAAGSYYIDDFDDSYAECAPLRRRALATGKRYWWNRYHACMED
jgi:hypothetical protein